MPDNHIMIVDSNPINQTVQIPYESIPIMGMTSMPGIPLTSYDGMAQIQHMGQPQNNANVSIPVNNISLNPINMNAIPTIPVNTLNNLQLPMSMQAVSMGVMDSQRNYGNINSGIEMPITRPVTVGVMEGSDV